MSVDDKVVSASFETTKFSQGAAEMLKALQKINESLAQVGKVNGLDQVEKSANKVNFSGLSSAIDKIKGKFTFREADQGFSEIEKSSSKVTFLGIGNAIDKIKGKFSFPEADAAFSGIERSSGRVTFSGLGRALDGITAKFSTVQAAASVALGNIATGAIQSGIQTAKGLSISPVTDGLREYETNLNSVQTILANTAASGAKLKDVNAALQELNTYSDKTIYNFSEMAKNIGTFTAAGVDLETATASIKGIANLAALSGSNSQQASTAMYQLSQAISAGRVSLQDWNSVVNAGMGGTVFQRALATTAQEMGTLKDGAVKLSGKMKNVTIDGKSFRESITAKPGEESWLTSKVLTNTLQQFTGDLSKAELKAQGFNDAQIKAIQSQAKMAQNAATQVKTLGAVIDTAKETAGSGWSQTWQLIFGDFGQAKTLFTGLSNAVNGVINDSANARNAVLKGWADLGGRKDLIEGIKNVFQGLGSVLKPIKEAFRDIFPPTTGKQLADITAKFRSFTEDLKIGPETADKLKRAFSGVFAVLDIGKQVVSGIFHVLGDLFSSVGNGSGGFLDLAAKIGDWVVSVDNALRKGNGLKNFFDGLGSILQVPIRLLGVAAAAVSGLFGGFDKGDADNVKKSLDGMSDSLNPLEGIVDGVHSAFGKLGTMLGHLKDAIGPALSSLGGLGSDIASGLAHTDWSAVFDAIQVGLLGGIFLLIKRFFSKGVSVNIGQGLLGNMSEAFETLTGTMKAMQTNIQADTLLKIAGAIGLLTASVVALSLIDSDGLQRSLTAMAVGFAQLLGAMKILSGITGLFGIIKIPVIAASLILLAGAVDVMVIAVAALSRLSWAELARGLSGVAALLTIVSAAAVPLSANAAGLTRAGVGITAIAIALNLLALAVLEFGHMDWKTIGRGLAGVAGTLVAVGSAANLFPTGLPAIGAGLILVAAGINLLALAVKQFGSMDLRTIGVGLGTTAAALVVIGAAMHTMPPGMALQAAGLVLVAAALNGIGLALKVMGAMSIGDIAKGLGALAGAMVILAGGLNAMTGTLAGSAALAVASASLTLLVPALKVLGGMSWGEIAKGLIALAGAFVVLGVAGVTLAPVAPALLALGGALLLIGGGFTLVGAGLTLISTAIAALAVAGPAGIKLLISALDQIAQAIPRMVTAFVMGLLTMVQKIAEVAPQFVVALGKIMVSLTQAVINTAPLLGDAMSAILQAGLQVIRDNFPSLVSTGLGMLTALLNGIKNNIGKVTTQVGGIIVNFLNALSVQLPRIVSAGTNLLVKLLSGVASNISKVNESAAKIITSFISSIGSGASRVATAGIETLARFITGIAGRLSSVVSLGGQVIAKLISGIASAGSSIVASAVSAAGKFVTAMANGLVKLVDTGAKAIINFLNGIASVIRTREPEILAAGINIGKAVVQGFLQGLASIDITGAIKRKFGGAVDSAKKLLHIKSPSQVFAEIGSFTMQGFAQGIDNDNSALSAITAMSYGLINGVKSIFQIQSPSKVMHDIGQFVGQGFADGLLGSKDDIDGAFTDLNNKVTDAMTTLRTTIASENDHLKKLREARKPDLDVIDKAKDAIKANKEALQELSSAHAYLGTALAKQKTDLDGVQVTLKGAADKMATITAQLDTANQALADAIKTRDDYKKSVTDQFGALPDIEMVDKDGNPIDPATQVANWMQALQNQASAVSTYGDTLEQLRKLGLDDATYQKLLQDGTADQAFASQLLAGGKTAVEGLNKLDAQLQSVSSALASKAAKNLYQAGVDSAQGLVDGLNAQQSNIRKAMERIAEAMIKAIKKKLHIRSPSRVFAEVGKFSAMGLVEGLDDNSKTVTDAAEKMADDTVVALRKGLAELPSALSANIDSSPVITPVLDLDQIRKDAKRLSDLAPVIPISAAVSFNQAAAIDEATSSTGTDGSDDSSPDGKVLQFNQYNTSPKALSETEVYRQTKNQLSLAQEMLDAM